jgi:hypothetical protein
MYVHMKFISISYQIHTRSHKFIREESTLFHNKINKMSENNDLPGGLIIKKKQSGNLHSFKKPTKVVATTSSTNNGMTGTTSTRTTTPITTPTTTPTTHTSSSLKREREQTPRNDWSTTSKRPSSIRNYDRNRDSESNRMKSNSTRLGSVREPWKETPRRDEKDWEEEQIRVDRDW